MAKTQLPHQEQLELFVKRVEELVSTRLYREQQLADYNPSILWEESAGLSFQAKEPDEDDLKSFLLTFRHFISEKEPTFFYSVRNTCYKCMKPNHDHELEQLKKVHKIWGDTLKVVGGFVIEIDGQQLTPEHTLDLYINGHYFHNDTDYREELRKLAKSPIPLDKMNFLLALQTLTNIIVWTGNFVGYGLKHDWFDFT